MRLCYSYDYHTNRLTIQLCIVMSLLACDVPGGRKPVPRVCEKSWWRASRKCGSRFKTSILLLLPIAPNQPQPKYKDHLTPEVKTTSPKNVDNFTQKLRLSHPKKVNNLIQNMKTTSPNKWCNTACKLLNMESLRQKLEIMNVKIVTFEQPIGRSNFWPKQHWGLKLVSVSIILYCVCVSRPKLGRHR